MTEVIPNQPNRGIGSIAHLFLSQHRSRAGETRTAPAPSDQTDTRPAVSTVIATESKQVSQADYHHNDNSQQIVFTTAESANIVAAYKNIKYLAQADKACTDISVFVCNVPNITTAKRAYRKLLQTSRDFLGIELSFSGWTTRSTPTNINCS